MHIVVGILLLAIGVIFPMAMLAWLNSRLGRQPRPTPRQIGLTLAFNGVFPAGLVLLGLGLMAPRLWEMPWLQFVTVAAWLVAGGLLIALMIAGRTGSRRGEDGR